VSLGALQASGLISLRINLEQAKIMNSILILRTSLILLFIPLVSCATAEEKGKYETAKYEAVLTEGAFEIRTYPEIVVASAPMNATRSGSNSAFRSLFRYISGGNEEQKKIAMTTPVFSTKVGEGKSMSFVVPAEVVAAGVPKATDGNVVVATRAKGRFAVYRYSGRWTTARENKARATLLAWIKEKELKTVGATETANYNSPMTLPFLRRNEVLVRLKN
jgi:hypothetical protein